MGYKKIGYIRQLWYVLKHTIRSWIERQDAKAWAWVYHPGWLQIATKARNEDTRRVYKQQILLAYREEEYG